MVQTMSKPQRCLSAPWDSSAEMNVRCTTKNSKRRGSSLSGPASKEYMNSQIKAAALLPEHYVPGCWDVICQRGKDCSEHVGNRRFRVCVENHVDSYVFARTRQDKSNVITSIVRSIKESSARPGGFVMKDPKTERWYHVDNKVARDKVGNALRDIIKQRVAGRGGNGEYAASGGADLGLIDPSMMGMSDMSRHKGPMGRRDSFLAWTENNARPSPTLSPSSSSSSSLSAARQAPAAVLNSGPWNVSATPIDPLFGASLFKENQQPPLPVASSHADQSGGIHQHVLLSGFNGQPSSSMDDGTTMAQSASNDGHATKPSQPSSFLMAKLCQLQMPVASLKQPTIHTTTVADDVVSSLPPLEVAQPAPSSSLRAFASSSGEEPSQDITTAALSLARSLFGDLSNNTEGEPDQPTSTFDMDQAIRFHQYDIADLEPRPIEML